MTAVRDFESFHFGDEATTHLIEELGALLATPPDVAVQGARRVRAHWALRFASQGWACDVPVAGSRLTVSFMRDHVAVCTQLGNVARTYADLLKLEKLFRMQVIHSAVEIVPTEVLSKQLGSNHASYERLAREAELFRDVITVPLLVIGVEY